MSWVRIDDAAPDHPKLVGLTDEAFALWVRGLCYCARHLTDGRIPWQAIRTMTASKRGSSLPLDLVAAGLWERDGEAYVVHDYLHFNPSASDVKSKREAKQEAGRKGGLRSGQVRSKEASKDEAGASVSGSTKTNPHPLPLPSEDPPVVPQGGPIAPEVAPLPPKPPKAERRKPARGQPEDWKPTERHYSQGARIGLKAADVEREASRFTDHHAARGSVFADWDAAFRTWLGNVESFARRAGPGLFPGQTFEEPRSVRAQRVQDREAAALREHGIDLDAIGRGGAS